MARMPGKLTFAINQRWLDAGVVASDKKSQPRWHLHSPN